MSNRGLLLALVLFIFVAASCNDSSDDATSDGDADSPTDGDEIADGDDNPDGDASTDGDDEIDSAPLQFVAATFNTGTTESKGDSRDDDAYTGELAKISDQYYGDGLAWTPAVEAAKEFLAEISPDVIVFQEIFYSGLCPDIPEDARNQFVCETWQEGDPTVAQVILGEGYQVMCHPGKDDKCAAVKRAFGTFRGCDSDFCLEGLEGYRVEDCGSGARVGRGIIDLVDGGELTLISVHGSSGILQDDQQCRLKQFEQVFIDFGDGEPAANGEQNLIMGDFNTDPWRLAASDPSAAILAEYVGEDKYFHFHTEVGEDATPTYGGLFSIDHVISNSFTGGCVHYGVTEGTSPVIDDAYFDHVPAACTLSR